MYRSLLTPFATFFLFIFNFWSCQDSNTPKDYLYLEGLAQGSTFNIQIDSQDTTFVTAILDLLKEQDTVFSLYRSSSYIKDINQSKRAAYNTYFAEVLKISDQIRKSSNGYFNPNVYQLFKYADTAQVLDAKKLEGLQKAAQHFEYEIRPDSILLGRDMELTFDAIAQGYTVDVIADYLESRGVLNYFVEVGGELRAKGVNSYGNTWTVGIEHPSRERKGIYVRKMGLDYGAIASSGNYRKFLNGDKERPHTIDPFTGRPKQTDIIACTVVAAKAVYADAYATAIMAMDEEVRKAFIASEQLAVLTITLKGDKVKLQYYNDVEDYIIEGRSR